MLHLGLKLFLDFFFIYIKESSVEITCTFTCMCEGKRFLMFV